MYSENEVLIIFAFFPNISSIRIFIKKNDLLFWRGDSKDIFSKKIFCQKIIFWEEIDFLKFL